MIRNNILFALLSGSALPFPIAAADMAADDAETIIVTGRAEKLYRVEQTTSGKLPTEPLASS
ncbi:MAG TPA: hypothetical protein VGN36_07605, partial [Sphingorhabdus sp.]|nr:hypothetical protein [Sphingorhabdus sp.]